MILFVTAQYAGAQYIHPLLKKWSNLNSPKWHLVATGASCKYWDAAKVNYDSMETPSIERVTYYINKIKPSLILLSASANIDLEFFFIKVSKEQKIITASFVDMWANYLMRFKHDGKLMFPDNILAIDEKCAEEMVSDGIPQNLIRIIGQPYLESLTKNIPILGSKTLFTSQPVKKYLNDGLGYDETDFWKICLPAIKKLGNDKALATLHPEEEIKAVKEANLNIIFSAGQGMKDIINCHTIIGMSSMQMMVGYLWGRKVASVQPRLRKKDPSPLSRWGLIPLLEKNDELVKFLQEKQMPDSNDNFKKNLLGSNERLEIFCKKHLKQN
jgi:hypothetical protein